MFRRRVDPSFLERLRGIVWPRMGLRRFWLYLGRRLERMRGSPHQIAAGFAGGAAVSFTTFLGFHVILAFLSAFLARGSYIAAAVGTLVGNLWTQPLIFAWDFMLGRWLIGRGEAPQGVEQVVDRGVPPVADLVVDLWHLVTGDASWIEVGPGIMHVFWPMTLGGLVSFLPVWILSYLLIHRLVSALQAARRHRLDVGRSDRTGARPVEGEG